MIRFFNIKIRKTNNARAGQSLIEVIVAMAIFSLIAASITSLIIGCQALLGEGGHITYAAALAEEGLEAARSIRDNAWNRINYSRSAVVTAGNKWDFSGEGTSQQIGPYTRTIDFYPVYRDNTGNIVPATSAGAFLDVEAKRVAVEIQWEASNGSVNSIDRETIITNWDSREWSQSDWQGGNGQEIWQDSDKYFSDDGNVFASGTENIALAEIATSTYANSGYIISSAFSISSSSRFTAIKWRQSLPDDCLGCGIRLQIKTAPDAGGFPGAWTADWEGPEGIDGDESDQYTIAEGQLIHFSHNNDQWLKYKAELFTEDPSKTPILQEVEVNYKNY